MLILDILNEYDLKLLHAVYSGIGIVFSIIAIVIFILSFLLMISPLFTRNNSMLRTYSIRLISIWLFFSSLIGFGGYGERNLYNADSTKKIYHPAREGLFGIIISYFIYFLSGIYLFRFMTRFTQINRMDYLLHQSFLAKIYYNYAGQYGKQFMILIILIIVAVACSGVEYCRDNFNQNK